MTFASAHLPAINSMTKYPSIPTYHALDPKNGKLLDKRVPFFGQVTATEKVDGTNARIVLFPDGDWLIGSREEIFTARHDRIPNVQLRIVEALRRLANEAAGYGGELIVLYLEVYGHGTGAAWKQYAAGPGDLGYRLFDAAAYHEAEDILTWPRGDIASWRDNGGQPYVSEKALHTIAHDLVIPLAPRLFTIDAAELPRDHEGMHQLLAEHLPQTKVALSPEAKGGSEGIVLRTDRRMTIAKARFQDYERTLKHRPVKGAPSTPDSQEGGTA